MLSVTEMRGLMTELKRDGALAQKTSTGANY